MKNSGFLRAFRFSPPCPQDAWPALVFFFILWIPSGEETESVQICGGLPSRHSKNVSSEGGGGRVYKMRWGDPPQLYIFVMGARATRLPQDVWPVFLLCKTGETDSFSFLQQYLREMFSFSSVSAISLHTCPRGNLGCCRAGVRIRRTIRGSEAMCGYDWR